MKKTRQVTITEIFCDVCGQKCGNHATRADAEGNEEHACLDFNEQHGKQCAAVLDERLLAAAIAKRQSG
ncbi:hypothetical protein JTL52_17735 [Pseudomonas aeruginosa]|nr:hypothetical protein [Pseudomonas aeruginosa]